MNFKKTFTGINLITIFAIFVVFVGLSFQIENVSAFGILGKRATTAKTLVLGVDKNVDKDNDGASSKIILNAKGHGALNEKGEDYDIQSFELGETKYVFEAKTRSGREGIIGIEEFHDSRKELFEIEKIDFKDSELKKSVGSDPIVSITATLYESDSGPHRVSDKDDYVGEVTISGLDIKMEDPNADRLVEYNLETNVANAEVYKIDDNPFKKKIGETSETRDTNYGPRSSIKIEWPVDVDDWNSDIYLQLEKEGYKTERFKVEDASKYLPDKKLVKLEKSYKPVIIKSTPADAEIIINGENWGQTSQMVELWSKKFPVDVKIKKEGYKTIEYQDIQSEDVINAKLEEIEQQTENQDNSSIINYDLGLDSNTSDTVLPTYNTYDMQSIVDSMPDIDSYFSVGFSYYPKKLEAGDDILFDAGNSFNFSNPINSYNWDFGDGETATGKNVKHAYDSSGSYTVQLTAIDSKGNKSSQTKSLSVENNEPKARFYVSKSNPIKGESIIFESNSKDFDGNIVSYNWDFGDGETASGKRASHVFDNTGEYVVKLAIKDNEGATDNITRKIKIFSKNNNPNAKFNFSPNSVEISKDIKFDASASYDIDGKIKDYIWSFGNGVLQKGETVSHKFKKEGEYKVRLSVMDDRGNFDSETKKVIVKKERVNKLLSQNTTCILKPNQPYTHPDTNTVWRITPKGTKQAFQKSRVFKTWYDSFDPVVETTKNKIEECKDDEAGFVPLGPKAKEQGLMKGGTLVKVTSDPKVYLLLDGKRYWITSEDVFNKLNYKWNWIQDGSMQLVNSFEEAGEINDTSQHKEGSLIKYPNSNKVYKLEKNNQGQMVKRHIKNEQVFNRLGYRFDRVVTIEESETYPTGNVLK